MRQQHGTVKPQDGYDHSHCLRIEFIGGPYDGHEQSWFALPTRLPTEVAWLVCEDAFRSLDGDTRIRTAALTSVALYELEIANGAHRYRFARALPVKDLIDSLSGL